MIKLIIILNVGSICIGILTSRLNLGWFDSFLFTTIWISLCNLIYFKKWKNHLWFVILNKNVKTIIYTKKHFSLITANIYVLRKEVLFSYL